MRDTREAPPTHGYLPMRPKLKLQKSGLASSYSSSSASCPQHIFLPLPRNFFSGAHPCLLLSLSMAGCCLRSMPYMNSSQCNNVWRVNERTRRLAHGQDANSLSIITANACKQAHTQAKDDKIEFTQTTNVLDMTKRYPPTQRSLRPDRA